MQPWTDKRRMFAKCGEIFISYKVRKSQISKLCYYIVFWWWLGFELRASCLLGKYCTAWITPPALKVCIVWLKFVL
jgi:hypothetical protein